MDKSRRIRIRCSAATESGTCGDPKTFYLDTVETAVLNGLTAELRHPEVIAQYVQTYHEERKRLAAAADARRTRLERRLEEVTREIERLVNAIAKGHGDPAVLGPHSTTLHEERKCILAELDQVPAATGVIALHPAVLARYEEQLNQLQTGLANGIASGDPIVQRQCVTWSKLVTVFRDPSRTGGVVVEIAGRLTSRASVPSPTLKPCDIFYGVGRDGPVSVLQRLCGERKV